MTPREIIKANIEFAGADRIGLNFNNEPDRISDFTGAGCDHGIEIKEWEEGPMEYYTDIWGNVWHRMKGRSKGGEVCTPIIPDWKDLDSLELPDLDNPAYFENARKLGASDTDLFKVGWMLGWPFATCRYMRTMEVYFTDLVLERERLDILHDRVTTLLEGVIEQYGKAGMDAVMYCEDLGVQDRLLIGPEMWRDIFRPLYERLTGKAHEYGMKVIMHSCGYNWDIIDDLCLAGVDCLQFDQPTIYDMPALAEKLKKHGVGLFSPCDIQQVLPTADKDLIRKETKRLVETFRGGFIAKDYTDLNGIGVDIESDRTAYRTFVETGAPELAGAVK
ncbi:MAG: uroporphyrinogen decarboxylase family protein [Spirochaetia bacterium]